MKFKIFIVSLVSILSLTGCSDEGEILEEEQQDIMIQEEVSEEIEEQENILQEDEEQSQEEDTNLGIFLADEMDPNQHTQVGEIEITESMSIEEKIEALADLLVKEVYADYDVDIELVGIDDNIATINLIL